MNMKANGQKGVLKDEILANLIIDLFLESKGKQSKEMIKLKSTQTNRRAF